MGTMAQTAMKRAERSLMGPTAGVRMGKSCCDFSLRSAFVLSLLPNLFRRYTQELALQIQRQFAVGDRHGGRRKLARSPGKEFPVVSPVILIKLFGFLSFS
jgi:hypothetical protein